jgi:hypothetical protein
MASRYTEKTEITSGEFYQIAGLLTVARRLTAQLDTIEREVATLVGEDPDNPGLAGDAMYARTGDAVEEARDLLRRSEIAVVEGG